MSVGTTRLRSRSVSIVGTISLAMVAIGAAAQAPKGSTSSDEKLNRTAAQQKIDSHLLQEISNRQGKAAGKAAPPAKTSVKVDPKGRALVDVRAEVTPGLQKKIRGLGGTIVETSKEYRSIVAWIPLLKLEQLAADSGVHAIQPKPEAEIR